MTSLQQRAGERAAAAELHKKVQAVEKASGVAPSPTSDDAEKIDKKNIQDDGVSDDADTEYSGSVGMATWATSADASYRPNDFGDKSCALSSLPLERIPSAAEEELDIDHCEGSAKHAGYFMKAAGGAAVTAAAAAAAANAAAPRQKPGGDAVDRLDSSPVRAPLGLSESMPSVGSGLHGSGQCSPCVWHWKPQGCQRGGECGYCHLCPEGEIKIRKKAKLAALRVGPNDDLAVDEEAKLAALRGPNGDTDEEEDDDEQSPMTSPSQAKSPTELSLAEERKEASTKPTTSVGSSLHGSGECRPCAWFWKAQGCQNAEECRHCHLCLEGEIKMRKKQKVDVLRKDAPGGEEEDNDGNEDEDSPAIILPPPGLSEPSTSPADKTEPKASTLKPGELASIGSSLHGSGECRPCAWFWKAQGCENAEECRHCHICPEGEIRNRKKVKVDTMRHEKQVEEKTHAHMQVAHMQAVVSQATQFCLPFLPSPLIHLPSLGSTLHGSGMCRPCAWFWKQQGCENGLECRHCHLCPDGEIKGRRKMKVAVLRHHGDMQQQFEIAQEMLKQHQDTWGDDEQQQWEADCAAGFYAHHGMAEVDFSPATVKHSGPSPKMDSTDNDSPAWVTTRSSPTAGESSNESPSAFFGSSSPVALELSSSLDLPSTGSALHPGRCRPCAWFWKSQGCSNAKACAHCHLCPEGELKIRKRVKESAMRTGALAPAWRSDVRSPRIVKIAPILGA